MQLYALEKEKLISAEAAKKGEEYLCPECAHPVRVRKGEERRAHFFHLKTPLSCRLSQKGIIHLQLQFAIKHLLASEKPILEKPFPEIGRIADVACMETKKIFEIQYSPMPLEEAQNRCRDYESIGYQVIWILHDHTFNQRRVGGTERFLRTKTCYYSNMDEEGKGEIYDQFEEVRKGIRGQKSRPQRVDLTQCFEAKSSLRPSWPLYHGGDLIDLHLQGELPKSWQIAQQKKGGFSLKDVYLTLLHQLLERCST